jgi:fumarate reductase subunit D
MAQPVMPLVQSQVLAGSAAAAAAAAAGENTVLAPAAALIVALQLPFAWWQCEQQVSAHLSLYIEGVGHLLLILQQAIEQHLQLLRSDCMWHI